MKKLLPVFFALITSFTFSQETSIPLPKCGYIEIVLINPNNPDTVLAATSSEVYKTTDGGKTWEKKLSAAGSDYLLAAPSNFNELYTRNWRSTDGGESWESITTIPRWGWRVGYYLAKYAIHPNKPNVLFAAEGKDIYRSTDSGTSWISVYGSCITGDYADCDKIIFDDTDNGIIYAIGMYSIVCKSKDGGDSWTEIVPTFKDIDDKYVNSFQFFGVTINKGILYSCVGYYYSTDRYFVRSADGGVTWTKTCETKPFMQICDYKFHGNDLYVAAYNGTYLSTDYGATWKQISDNDTYYYVDINSTNIVLASYGRGVSMSKIGDNKFENIGVEHISSNYYRPLTLNSGNILLYSSNGYPSFVYHTDGKYWYTIEPCRSDYFGTNGYAYSSKNNLLYTIRNKDLYKSSDEGKTWTFVSTLTGSGTLFAVSDEGNQIFINSNSSLTYSTNGGTSWKSFSTPSSTLHYAKSTNVLYANNPSTGKIQYSTFNGSSFGSWTNTTSESDLINNFYYSEFPYDQQSDDELYTIISSGLNNTVLKKSAGTYHWENVFSNAAEGPPYYLLYSGIYVSNSGDKLFCRGMCVDAYNNKTDPLYCSKDKGVTWEKIENTDKLSTSTQFKIINNQIYHLNEEEYAFDLIDSEKSIETAVETPETDGFRIISGKNLVVNSNIRQKVNVCGIDGRIIRSLTVNEGETTINGLSRGIYIVNGHKTTVW